MGEIPIQFQLAIVGDSEVGKTSLIHRFVQREELRGATPTVGIEVKQHGLERDEREIKVAYFDTAGDEKMRAMPETYLRNSEGVMIVYDITDDESYNKLDFWLQEARQSAREGAVIMVVGNKRDERHKRQVDSSDVLKWVKDSKIEGTIREQSVVMNAEVSAKSGEGVEEAFAMLVDATYEKFYRRQVLLDKIAGEMPAEEDDIVVPASATGPGKKDDDKGCCVIS